MWRADVAANHMIAGSDPVLDVEAFQIIDDAKLFR
jgi:hypothetical protein